MNLTSTLAYQTVVRANQHQADEKNEECLNRNHFILIANHFHATMLLSGIRVENCKLGRMTSLFGHR